MEYPRLKPFAFNIMTTYNVPAYHVGRLDLISCLFYNSPKYYKVIASANNINLSTGIS